MKKTNLDILDLPDNPVHMSRFGHATVVDVVFDILPQEITANLDKEIMKESSDDPDQKFKDMVNHHYPPSYKKATKWLDEGKTSYDNKDYKHASYCFGVASHYISDTFMAPHCVSRESNKDHHNFEKAIDTITPKADYLKGDLESLMIKGVEQGQKDWKIWKQTKDISIVQSEADEAASTFYSIMKNILS